MLCTVFKNQLEAVKANSAMAALLPCGYRSVTEYRFREDQTDAIVRVAAYHHKDYCHSVI